MDFRKGSKLGKMTAYVHIRNPKLGGLINKAIEELKHEELKSYPKLIKTVKSTVIDKFQRDISAKITKFHQIYKANGFRGFTLYFKVNIIVSEKVMQNPKLINQIYFKEVARILFLQQQRSRKVQTKNTNKVEEQKSQLKRAPENPYYRVQQKSQTADL